jgi:hypothetical protein
MKHIHFPNQMRELNETTKRSDAVWTPNERSHPRHTSPRDAPHPIAKTDLKT